MTSISRHKIEANISRFQYQNEIWTRLFYLQSRSLCLWFVSFTYGGGAVSKKDQTQFPDGGSHKQKTNKAIFHRKQKIPNRISTVSKKKTKPNFNCKQKDHRKQNDQL